MAAPSLRERFVTPIKALTEGDLSFGHRTGVHLLELNKNTLQRIFQIKRWLVRKRPVGFNPRIQSLPSVAKVRWATDICRAWARRDFWATLALAME